MSTHIIKLTEKEIIDQRAGNSMSTTISWIPKEGKATVYWKNFHEVLQCVVGDHILISCNGGFPTVKKMTSPKEEVAKIAWNYLFFKKKRYPNLSDLIQAAETQTYYSHLRASYMPSVKIYKKDNCAVAYKRAMEGQVGTPWGWWASSNCTPVELENLIHLALKKSALHEYS